MQFIDPSDLEEFLTATIYEATGKDLKLKYAYADLSDAQTKWMEGASAEGEGYLVKWFEGVEDSSIHFAERDSTEYIKKKKVVNLPEVIGLGYNQQKNWILYALPERKDIPESQADLGVQLANLHKLQNPNSGLHFNNYLGQLLQLNTFEPDALNFWVERRLLAQAGLALYEEKISFSFYERFLNLKELIPNLLPSAGAVLLHGQLWEQNFFQLASGQLYFSNPACYYGLREAEIANTRLLGYYNDEFYNCYLEILPLEPGFEQRKDLYNLHPLLVMVNQGQEQYIPGIADILLKYGC